MTKILIVPFEDTREYTIIENGQEIIMRCPTTQSGRLMVAVGGIF